MKHNNTTNIHSKRRRLILENAHQPTTGNKDIHQATSASSVQVSDLHRNLIRCGVSTSNKPRRTKPCPTFTRKRSQETTAQFCNSNVYAHSHTILSPKLPRHQAFFSPASTQSLPCFQPVSTCQVYAGFALADLLLDPLSASFHRSYETPLNIAVKATTRPSKDDQSRIK